jgi:hypothetical protein
MIFTSEALKKWRDSDAERETGENQVDLCGRHKWIFARQDFQRPWESKGASSVCLLLHYQFKSLSQREMRSGKVWFVNC